MKIFYTLCLFFLVLSTKAQFVLPQQPISKVSLVPYAAIADVGQLEFKVEQIKNENFRNVEFNHFKDNNANLGFTNHTYWLKFEINNSTALSHDYYLEVGEPMTDEVNLFVFEGNKLISSQKSGDDMLIKNRSLDNRKPIFKINLSANQQYQYYLEIKNDGERNSLPINLINPDYLLKTIYKEHLIFGAFYGILMVIAIIYLFFYFALNERSFLYYVLYVLFVALCHFSLDGYFYQYITQDNSWFSLHAVIIFAIFSCFFFGKFTQVYLELRKYNYKLYLVFKTMYALLMLTLLGIILIPSFFAYSYPIVNGLTFLGILMIAYTLISQHVRKQPIDAYFTAGLIFLFICIALAILQNFDLLNDTLIFENITKMGIGVEIIALSIAMANKIRLLKTAQEKSQTLALQRSEEINELKTYFLRNMSHELRTPLNAILGVINTMESETADQKVIANYEMIKYVSNNLMSSVNDILDFSKIADGELALDYIDFNPFKIFDTIRISAEREAEDKGLNFVFAFNGDKEISVIGDPIRLEQIIRNIVNNAIKFTNKGEIEFFITANLKKEEISYEITVKDSGVGISPGKIGNVFEMFTQANIDNKRKFGGFGIGLGVSKALIDLHQGEISISSEPDKGTICIIKLNYEGVLPTEMPVNLFPLDNFDLLGKQVLIVEDNKMNQMVIKMMMNKWANTSTVFAADGKESLEILKNSDNIDIVLMDLQMPVMDGYEAIEAIRKGEAGVQNEKIPIVVLSADVLESTKQRVFSLGANDYLTKPVESKLLYQKITSVLSQQCA